MQVAVVSSRAQELRAALALQSPSDVEFHYAQEAGELSALGREAAVALGAPDVLAPALANMPNLRWVQSTWAGITPFLAVSRRDYLLTGVKDIFGASMSEYVLGWMFALQRNILKHAKADKWHWAPERGTSGLRLGIAGAGSIGSDVATACQPFFAEVVGLNRDGRPARGCARCFGVDDKLRFAAGLDALVMILPDTPQTDDLVDAEFLAKLARGAVLLNVGRANSLDHEALQQAVLSGVLSAAVLDVLPVEPLPDDDPLWEIEGVHITSHTAAPTQIGAIAQVFLDNLHRYRQGRPLEGLIDFTRGY